MIQHIDTDWFNDIFYLWESVSHTILETKKIF